MRSVRTYRNRRIGDFLKELHLTEGRCTGVPKIRKAMEENGSPMPIFKTDENLSFFLVTLPIHPEASLKNRVFPGRLLEEGPKTHQLEVENTPAYDQKHTSLEQTFLKS